MGTTFSSGRIAAATELPINATNSTEVPAGVAARPAQRDVLRAQGTYFGPNFVLDSTGAMAGVSNSMAFWEDILNVLAVGGGNGGASQVLGNVYSNIPPPEMKPCVTLKANLNLVKNSLRLTRVEETAGGAYQIGFKFDTLVDAYVKIYWGATERRRVDSNGKVTYEFVKGNREAIPWLFGPFKAGMDQVFELPANCLINDSLLEQVNLNWISEMDLLATPQIVTPNISSDPLNMPENIIKSVMVNMEPGEAADLIKPIDLRHLIVVIEDAKSEITSTSRISDAQITFANFTQSKDKQLQVRFSKQLLLADGVSYVLQEIYGFTEQTSTEPSSQRECVVCMSETKDTLVLPCRHLCLCQICADTLRLQGRTSNSTNNSQGPPKCPICRQVFHSLLSISLPAPFNLRESYVSNKSRNSLLPVIVHV